LNLHLLPGRAAGRGRFRSKSRSSQTCLNFVPFGTPFSRINALKQTHPSRKVGLRRLKQQVVVIANQYIAMNTPPATLPGLPKRLQANPAVSIITKNRFQSVATVHHVLQHPFIFHSRLPRHLKKRHSKWRNVNRGELTRMALT